MNAFGCVDSPAASPAIVGMLTQARGAADFGVWATFASQTEAGNGLAPAKTIT